VFGFVPLPGTKLLSIDHANPSGAVLVRVASALADDLLCPYCAGVRFKNGTRASRFRDVPNTGIPVVIAWKRQNFLCKSCGRASKELNPAFSTSREMTQRLVAWIADESQKRTFKSVAQTAGIDEQVVRRVFRSIEKPFGALAKTSKVMAAEMIMLAGRERPALIDVENERIINVFETEDDFALVTLGDAHHFGRVKLLVTDIELDVFAQWIPAAQRAISVPSVIRAGTKRMMNACGELFNKLAEKEKLSIKFARVLFSRRESQLKHSSRRRLRGWQNNDQELYATYQLKEDFVKIWGSPFRLEERYREWKIAADKFKNPNLRSVIDLVTHRRLELILQYHKYEELKHYAERLPHIVADNALRKTHSFIAARASLLSKQTRILPSP
jgi:transposase